MQAFKAWLVYYGPCCTFQQPAGPHPQAGNQNLFTSHFDWFGIHLPRPAQDRSGHFSYLHHKGSQDLPNFQDIMGHSAYQFTKIWIVQSNLGPNFSFSLTSSLACNICICSFAIASHHSTCVHSSCHVDQLLLLVVILFIEARASCSTCHHSDHHGFQHTAAVVGHSWLVPP